MIPLAISINGNLSSSIKTSFIFNEDDLKKNLINVSSDLLKDSKLDQSFYVGSEYIRDRLRIYLSKWNKETIFSSDISAITKNSNFRNILSLGKSAVPVILEEIYKKPSKLVWALNYIEGFNISTTPVSIDEACKLWVKWGLTKSLIA